MSWLFAASRAVAGSIWVISEASMMISSHSAMVFSFVPSLRNFRAVSANTVLGVYTFSAFSSIFFTLWPFWLPISSSIQAYASTTIFTAVFLCERLYLVFGDAESFV